MKKGLLFLFIIFFVMGGCDKVGEQKDVSKMDPKDLPKVTAYQDDFTREFMAQLRKRLMDTIYFSQRQVAIQCGIRKMRR